MYILQYFRNSLLFLLLFFSLGVASANQAPDFRLPGLKGDVALSDYQGKIIYLDFWASWCIPCRKSFPWMNDLAKKFAKQGLEVVAINVDENREDAEHFLKRYPADFTLAFDHKGVTPAQYKVKGMPSSYLIDRSGKIIYQHIGFRHEDIDAMEARIRKALK